MEEKKSKKSKKKKNRSAQASSIHGDSSSSHHVSLPNALHSTPNGVLKQSSNISDLVPGIHVHGATPSSHHASRPDPRGSASNGYIPDENRPTEEEQEEEEGEEKNDPPQVRSPHSYLENEIFSSQQLARELKMALVSEIESSQSLRNLIEDLKSSHETSKEGLELLIKQLREELIQLRESENHQKLTEVNLKGEIQLLRDENMELRAMWKLQGDVEATKQTQIELLKADNDQLREDNIHLVRKVEEMKNTVEQFQHERRQLTSKMSAMQMGINQLEREAAIRAHIENELSSVPSKGWFGWGSRKSSAVEATAFAEDSRMQMMAAAGMVEKLVAENSALVEKVNEQTSLIDRITRKYSYLMEMQSIGRIGRGAEKYVAMLDQNVVKQSNEVLPVIEDKTLSEKEIIPMIEDIRQIEKDVLPVVEDKTQSEEEIIPMNGNTRQLEIEVLPTIERKSELEKVRPMIENRSQIEEPQLRMAVEDLHMTSPEMINMEVQHVPPQTTKSETPQNAIVLHNDVKPFSDAPIMGAPIRLFSFIAKYVSGADLVTAES